MTNRVRGIVALGLLLAFVSMLTVKVLHVYSHAKGGAASCGNLCISHRAEALPTNSTQLYATADHCQICDFVVSPYLEVSMAEVEQVVVLLSALTTPYIIAHVVAHSGTQRSRAPPCFVV